MNTTQFLTRAKLLHLYQHPQASLLPNSAFMTFFPIWCDATHWLEEAIMSLHHMHDYNVVIAKHRKDPQRPGINNNTNNTAFETFMTEKKRNTAAEQMKELNVILHAWKASLFQVEPRHSWMFTNDNKVKCSPRGGENLHYLWPILHSISFKKSQVGQHTHTHLWQCARWWIQHTSIAYNIWFWIF